MPKANYHRAGAADLELTGGRADKQLQIGGFPACLFHTLHCLEQRFSLADSATGMNGGHWLDHNGVRN